MLINASEHIRYFSSKTRGFVYGKKFENFLVLSCYFVVISFVVMFVIILV